MPRQDDPSIDGDMLLYRRVPPFAGRVIWTENGAEATGQNFSDGQDELSVYIATETTPDEVLAGNDGYGVVAIPARVVREACRTADGQPAVIICRDDEEPARGHTLVCGHISPGMRKKLKRAAQWVRLPTRVNYDSPADETPRGDTPQPPAGPDACTPPASSS